MHHPEFIAMSCDSRGDIPKCIINVVMALVDVYRVYWINLSPEDCNQELPFSLFAFAEESVFQVW